MSFAANDKDFLLKLTASHEVIQCDRRESTAVHLHLINNKKIQTLYPECVASHLLSEFQFCPAIQYRLLFDVDWFSITTIAIETRLEDKPERCRSHRQ